MHHKEEAKHCVRLALCIRVLGRRRGGARLRSGRQGAGGYGYALAAAKLASEASRVCFAGQVHDMHQEASTVCV